MQLSKTVRKDPMQSKGLVREYEKKLVAPFRKLKLEAVSLLRAHSHELEEFTGRELEIKVDLAAYARDLMDAIYNLIYDPLSQIVIFYTEQSYKKGTIFASLGMNRMGLNVSESLFPIDWRAIDILKTRNLTALKGITDEVNKAIIQELTAGMQNGEGIVKLSKRIEGRIENIGMARARVMARHETSFAFNNATMTRYHQYGVSKVEWLTGQDERVCEECGPLNGKVFNIDSAPECPLHAQCRCTLLAVPDDTEVTG